MLAGVQDEEHTDSERRHALVCNMMRGSEGSQTLTDNGTTQMAWKGLMLVMLQ